VHSLLQKAVRVCGKTRGRPAVVFAGKVPSGCAFASGSWLACTVSVTAGWRLGCAVTSFKGARVRAASYRGHYLAVR
jgi:hypothetical protein